VCVAARAHCRFAGKDAPPPAFARKAESLLARSCRRLVARSYRRPEQAMPPPPRDLDKQARGRPGHAAPTIERAGGGASQPRSVASAAPPPDKQTREHGPRSCPVGEHGRGGLLQTLRA
jgi:hypothetical protein